MKYLILIASAVMLLSCEKPVPGCLNPTADNYDEHVDYEDGSCVFTSEVMFYTNDGVPPIEVTVNGKTSRISAPVADINPDCGSENCARFTLNALQWYDYYAIDLNTGLEWTGEFIVPKGKCLKIRIQ